MIGLGIDIVKISRIEKLCVLYGSKFLEKVFSEEEINESLKKGHYYQSLAGKFAVKEAFFKASSGLVKNHINFLTVSILCDKSNKPTLTFNSSDIIGEQYTIHISISHEKEYAIAVVVID